MTPVRQDGSSATGIESMAARRGSSMSKGSEDLAHLEPIPIRMEDHTTAPTEYSAGTWAFSVHVGDYSIVGELDKAGSYVMWLVTIEAEEGAVIQARKRYSEFVTLREQLRSTFPNFTAALPELPPKSVVSKFRPSFLEKRRKGLEYFLSCVLLNPQYCGTPIVRSWIFS